MSIEVPVEQLPHGKGLPLPDYETAGAAGLDLMAALNPGEVWRIGPGERRLVPTGLKLAIPQGFEAQIRPRSGLALRHGIFIPNSPGTIDSDYRGEVQVILANSSQEIFSFERGTRIAQLILARAERLEWRLTGVSAGDTTRGAGGFGSTGAGAGN